MFTKSGRFLQVTQRVGTMEPQRAEVAIQIAPEEKETVAKRHVAMGTDYHHITRSVGDHLWTEDQETETEILTRETGADPVPELLEELLKADRAANAPVSSGNTGP